MLEIAHFLSALASLAIIVTAVYAVICLCRDHRRGKRMEQRGAQAEKLTDENTTALNRLAEAKQANTAALRRRSRELRQTREEIAAFRNACERMAELGIPVPKP